MHPILDLVDHYLTRFPAEAERLAILRRFLSGITDPAQLISRKNFDGHLTASAFIVDPKAQTLLLIHHRFLDKWLQPGGHLEPGETLLAAALREAHEEVGLPSSALTHLPLDPACPLVPLDIDSHYIPANEKKHELPHHHHDFRFLFLCDSASDLTHNLTEIHAARWTAFAEHVAGTEFAFVIPKIRAALAR